ncbi:acyltransferase family protein [Sabulicella glaciei]|uniref:Acyltransferase n=1 Tax=Sabulicella glaciei TaxID=2984948 RepID=A0ABT3NZF4_9PROT|nr:acyltransferase [Roseococcus sp. MDT2-1-1]
MEILKPLTSLRFFAALSIVMLHSMLYFPWASVFRGFPLVYGVSFFFVLSGFILTHVYSQRPTSYNRFMWARFAKLWPVHAATLLMVLLFIRPDSQQLPGTGWFDPRLAMVANLFLVHSIIPFELYVFSWNSVSWSISTEIGFYLAFPMLLLGLRGTWHIKLFGCFGFILLYGIAFDVFSVPVVNNFTSLGQEFLTYSSPLFRLAEFVVGMSAYALSHRWRNANISVWLQTAAEAAALLILVAWFVYGFPAVYGLLLQKAPSILLRWFTVGGSCFAFALVIAVFSKGKGLIGHVLSTRPLVWLGEISFALYMVHQITMKWFYLKRIEGLIDPAGPILAFGACIALAALLHHGVEVPMHSRLTGRRPWFRKASASVSPEARLITPESASST